MIKKVYFIVGVVVLLCLLGVAGCGTDKNVIKGKYVSANDDLPIYFEFSKDGTYTTNYYEIVGEDWYDYGTYSIEDNKLILFQGEDLDSEVEFGYIYKDAICSKWEGKLPLKNETEESYIQHKESERYLTEIQFKKDGTYESKVMECAKEICGYGHDHDYEVYKTTTGTYKVNKNKVTGEREDNKIDTFYNTDNGVYGVNYVKE